MAPPKQKDTAECPSTSPSLTAMQSTSSSASHPPNLTAVETILKCLTAPNLCSVYITTPNLTQVIKFQTSKNSSDILIHKETNMEFILQGVFLIACSDFFLTPDANFDPENVLNMHFQDVKLSCHLTSPTTPTHFPFTISDFPKCISNLHSIEKTVKLEKEVEIVSAISEHLSKANFKVHHPLFEVSTPPID